MPAPRTWVIGETVTAALMNQEIRDGEVALRKPVIALVRHSVGTSVASGGSGTILPWDTEDLDPNAIHDPVTNNSRFTPNVAGWYEFMGLVAWPSNVTNRRGLNFLKNGVTTFWGQVQAATPISTLYVKGERLIQMNGTTDFVEMRAFQDSGVALTITVVDSHFQTKLVWFT